MLMFIFGFVCGVAALISLTAYLLYRYGEIEYIGPVKGEEP